jgi:integrase
MEERPLASIEKRVRNGQTRWYARYRDPAGKQRTKSFARRIDAERYLTAVESSKLTGSYVDPMRARMTVGELSIQWSAAKVNLKPTTRARYASALKVHVLPRWKTTPLGRVEHGDLQTWVVELSTNGQSGASVRKSFGVLSSILDLAVRTKRIPSNPAVGVHLPPMNQKRRQYLTAAQVEQLAKACAELPLGRPKRASNQAFSQYRLAVLVLSYCGLRWSELAGLKADRIDLSRKRIEVAEAVTEVDGGAVVWGTPKSHERRSVPLPSFLANELALHLAERSGSDLVFTAPNGGVLRNRNARREWFDRAASAIGKSGLTPHELRHTAASLAVSAGANVKAVQRMLGHASAAMTLDRYADLFDDDLDAVADRLDTLGRAAGVYPVCTSTEIEIQLQTSPEPTPQ